jgi:NAD(P)-dependent dehydrogenase (short-subunit alcohol dehydrogenase family)
MDLSALLRGKKVLVTGASSGLGAHFAKLSAKSGARVTIAARRKDRLEALAPELTELGASTVEVLALDVADENAVQRAVEGVSSQIDVLVNNAGVNEIGPAIDLEIETFDRILDTNLRGVWLMSVACARRWRREARGGSIVNIASILSSRLLPGLAPYSVSKAAAVKLTEAHALEWARYSIRVNAIAPGYMASEINEGFFESPAGQAMLKRIPLRRFGKSDDLDACFLLLATEASSWMTGATLTVDGGHTLSTL